MKSGLSFNDKFIAVAVSTASIAGLLFLLLCAGDSEAQKVKYCKDYNTGKIIVVDWNMPCPGVSVEL